MWGGSSRLLCPFRDFFHPSEENQTEIGHFFTKKEAIDPEIVFLSNACLPAHDAESKLPFE